MKNYTFDSITDFFDKRYKAGEEVLAEKKLYAVDLLEKTIPSNSDKSVKVLDIGCGSGRITTMLSDKGYDVTGTDISEVAIQKLEERGIHGIVHDVKDKLPFDDGEFDVIFSTDLLELVPDIFIFLSEVRRVAKKDALFVFTTINMAWLPYRFLNCLGYSSSDLMPPSHCRFWTKKAVNHFINNEFYRMKVWGGVVVLPRKIFGKYSRLRTSFVNLFSREIVGIAEIINKG